MQRQLSPREWCASIQSAATRQRFFKECDCIAEHLPPIYPTIFQFMSQHPSLKGKSSISARRSVLKRFERVELLRKRGQFKDGQRVIGLPKTKPED
jgi:small basic protein (TIGR04137 family)